MSPRRRWVQVHASRLGSFPRLCVRIYNSGCRHALCTRRRIGAGQGACVRVPALCGALNRGPFVIDGGWRGGGRGLGLCGNGWPRGNTERTRGPHPVDGAGTIISRRSEEPPVARGHLVMSGSADGLGQVTTPWITWQRAN